MPDYRSPDDLDRSAITFDRLFDELDARYGTPDPCNDLRDDPYHGDYDDGYPIGGIPSDDDDYDDDPEWDLFLSECREDEEIEMRQADADEAALYARLERPRKRRQKPLPTYHFKRWGHGNAKYLMERIAAG